MHAISSHLDPFIQNFCKLAPERSKSAFVEGAAYLRHLFKAEEMLAMRLAVAHNLYFYNDLTKKIRDSLDEGRFESFRREYCEILDKRI